MKLHLGCGSIRLPGYVNTDTENWSGKCDVVCDARNLSQWSDVEEVYSHSVLEHIPPWDTEHTLTEWFRVLKPGGIVRVEVPDLERCYEDWKAGLIGETEYINNVYGGNKAPGRKFAATQHHLTGFTFAILSRILAQVGFVDVQRYEHETYHHCLAMRARKP